MTNKSIRIGCAGGFYGDTSIAAPQLCKLGNIDYLMLDYLAEVTMAILARAKKKDSSLGYAVDFVSPVLKSILPDVAAKGIKVVTNAGGVNPTSCAEAIRELVKASGLSLKVAAVEGDNVIEQANTMTAGDDAPQSLLTANAYLGATPIQQALANGADIVVTGRCVDSALVLGPLMHEFDWKADQFDLLSAGSLAGHVVECGAQATGGNFTDWQDVPDWENMGFPIAECYADGSFVVSKPANTGGLISRGTVSEQIVYEIGDPAAYLLPDVSCDWTQVQLTDVGENLVRVEGAKGFAPTSTYKIGACAIDGVRATFLLFIGGADADAKGRRTAAAVLSRVSSMLKDKGLAPIDESSVEVLGAESTYGPNRGDYNAREVIVKIAVRSSDKRSVNTFIREVSSAATGMAPGISGGGLGLPKASPRIVFQSLHIEKSTVPVTIDLGDRIIDANIETSSDAQAAAPVTVEPSPVQGDETLVPVLLRKLAFGRSGDKGDHANIGVIAREARFFPYIDKALSADTVKAYMAHTEAKDVQKFHLPGLHALNFLLLNALGGGGTASLRFDPQGKAFGQQLLDIEVGVPEAIAKELNASA